MAIHTQESLSGFIASEPLLTETAKGDARFFARIGKEHFRREDDGSFKIGHDAARTRYEVDRTPRNSAGRDAAAYEPPQRTNAVAQAAPVSM